MRLIGGRKKSLLYHPDKHGKGGDEASVYTFHDLNCAKKWLENPGQRLTVELLVELCSKHQDKTVVLQEFEHRMKHVVISDDESDEGDDDPKVCCMCDFEAQKDRPLVKCVVCRNMVHDEFAFHQETTNKRTRRTRNPCSVGSGMITCCKCNDQWCARHQ